jgi:hypothetical protein
MNLLRLGQWSVGWQQAEARLDVFAAQGWQPPSQAPRWSSDTPLAGRRVCVHSEQGLGDTLQFSRLTLQLQQMGAHVLLEVQPPLRSLLARALPGIEVLARGEALPAHDLQCPLMSLPLALRTDGSAPPPPTPLQADPARVADWQARLGPRTRPRVGLVWSGNPQQNDDTYRSIPLATLLPTLHPGVEWISLQQAVQPWDQATLGRSELRHFGDALADFEDTAALCEHMDLIVSVCTSVGHLAGSLGRPLCLVLAHTADWRWLTGRHDSQWYPSARVFRQPAAGDWPGALAQLRAEMDARF